MIPAGAGSIVLIASQAALLSLPTRSAYTASKGAVAAMTRSQAIDWAGHGIRVNAICPDVRLDADGRADAGDPAGARASVRRIPLGRMGQPAEVAGVVAFLCSTGRRLITGHVLPVDGGWTAGEPGLDL